MRVRRVTQDNTFLKFTQRLSLGQGDCNGPDFWISLGSNPATRQVRLENIL